MGKVEWNGASVSHSRKELARLGRRIKTGFTKTGLEIVSEHKAGWKNKIVCWVIDDVKLIVVGARLDGGMEDVGLTVAKTWENWLLSAALKRKTVKEKVWRIKNDIVRANKKCVFVGAKLEHDTWKNELSRIYPSN